MKPYLCESGTALSAGDEVEACFCSGRYGETTTVRGTIVSLDTYGGMTLKLPNGKQQYATGCFAYDFQRDARVGRKTHDDVEHGHTAYCRKLDTFSQFVRAVEAAGWTEAQLRCDAPPTDDLLELMDRMGLEAYEACVTLYGKMLAQANG